jgi:hypothetical protein
MRVRMTRSTEGEVDGILLNVFQAGLTYDVAPSLGSYLITTDCAVPVGADDPALLVPILEAYSAMSAERMRAVAAQMARARRDAVLFISPESEELH